MNGIIITIFTAYAIALISLQYIKISSPGYKYIIRKSVHLVTGLFIFFLTFHLEKQDILILISAGTVFSIITYNLEKFNFIHTTSGSSLGTIFYPIGILTSYLLLYNMPVYYFQITLMILSVSDTIANFCGLIRKKNVRFSIFNEPKSIFGVTGFVLSAYLLHIILMPEPQSSAYTYILLSVIAAVNFEIISVRGSDNFTIPAGCSLFFLLTQGSSMNPVTLIIIILMTATGSILISKKNILTRNGSVATYMIGIYFFTVLGPAWSVPVITFFMLSVIFTKINGFVNRKSEETNRRNIWQVFANILFAAVSSAFYQLTGKEIFIYFFITLVATVTADTWASELGPVFSKKCFSLSDFKFKKSGVSGGISFPGTIAALAGSLVITVLSCYLFFHSMDKTLIITLTLAGFVATFVDSLLSAFLEPVLLNMNFFKKETGPDSPSPNDIVNLSASATAPVFFLLFRMIM